MASVSRLAPSSGIGVAGALVRGPDGQPKALHLSLPTVPVYRRKQRAWLRAKINSQVAGNPGVPIIFHRLGRNGMTNKRTWLAWL